MQFATPLPIDAVLDDIGRVLVERGIAVLVAPPGAGKTTRVPLALMDAAWTAAGKILVLEPRRIAARAAAERMAATLSEGLGQSIGLRARLSSKTGPKARVEVVTEGVFTRMILDDPELAGVSAVLFDEFHERSLDADLGLALALEARRLAAGFTVARHVGNARRRARGKAARGCARHPKPRPRLSGRSALSRAVAGAHRGRRDRCHTARIES